MKTNIIHNEDCLPGMGKLPDGSVDLVVTDPPYGIGFMGKEWDKFNDIVNPQGAYEKKKGFKKLPRQSSAYIREFFTPIWKEALRVLKPGAFAFVMCIPRQDCLARMIVSLEDVGFNVSFSSIYWAYASGFPKAQNIGKAVDKRNGRHQDNRDVRQYLRDAIKQSGKTQKEVSDGLGTFMLGHYIGDSQPTLPTVEHWQKLKVILNLDNRFDELIEREEAEREVIGKKQWDNSAHHFLPGENHTERVQLDETLPATPQAQALDGSYGGFQPKPAVEIVIVAMKPLSEKTYVDQALANRHGISWLDDCRVPYESSDKPSGGFGGMSPGIGKPGEHQEYRGCNEPNNQGRFPGNLLVSDDVLNDGKIRKSGKGNTFIGQGGNRTEHYFGPNVVKSCIGDSGSFSRYFSLDSWFDKKLSELPEGVRRTFPFLVVPKASKAEKNRGCEGLPNQEPAYKSHRPNYKNTKGIETPYAGTGRTGKNFKNFHPTVKPIKLMSYLITLGSREGDIILDPFIGSGTTAIAAVMTGRHYIGYETDREYVKIANSRLSEIQLQLL